MSELQHLLEGIEEAFGIRICVHDISGITIVNRTLELSMDWKTHGGQYCTVAKDYGKVQECMRQKEIALWKLKRQGSKPYCGICHMGVCDYLFPVIQEDKLLAVVFASGVAREMREDARTKLEKQIRKMPYDVPELRHAYEEYARFSETSEQQLRILAEFVASYIRQAIQLNLIHQYLPEDPVELPVEPVKAMGYGTAAVIVNYLAENYNKQLSLKALSMRFFLSEGHLNRLVHQEVGMGAMAYVKKLRVQAASRMLENSDRPIREISEAVGYKDMNYFCRVFKAETGINPSNYRNQHTKFKQKAQTKH